MFSVFINNNSTGFMTSNSTWMLIGYGLGAISILVLLLWDKLNRKPLENASAKETDWKEKIKQEILMKFDYYIIGFILGMCFGWLFWIYKHNINNLFDRKRKLKQ